MKSFTKIYQFVCNMDKRYRRKRELRKLKRCYPDFEEESEYDDGENKFIWGIRNPDTYQQPPASLKTMNDIEIIYSRKNKRYALYIETAYWFESQDDIVEYLQRLLNAFTNYMDEQGYIKDTPYKFWMSQPSRLLEEETISELYTSFRIFVEGYIKIYSEFKVI